MIRNVSPFMVTASLIVAVALTPGAAVAQSYSGNWPVNVALPPHYAHSLHHAGR
jgi:hypothetical protein